MKNSLHEKYWHKLVLYLFVFAVCVVILYP